MLTAGPAPVRVLPVDPGEGGRRLLQSQVAARSAPGALVPDTGGLLPEDGWVRVSGGVFAPNGHDAAAVGRPRDPGRMTCFAPDTLEWEARETGRSAWVAWPLSGQSATSCDGLRRPGRREETATLALSQGVAVHPFLRSEESRADLAGTPRQAAAMRQVLGAAPDFARRAGPAAPRLLGEVRVPGGCGRRSSRVRG